MSDKYSGAFIPGMGGDGDEPSPPSRASSYTGAYDWRKVRDEQKKQLASWMNGREPREWWETYDNWENEYGFVEQKFFCMEFPGTSHYFVVAWERAPEIGRLYVWCFGCKGDQCGASKWIRNAYVVAIKADKPKLFGHAKETDLPF